MEQIRAQVEAVGIEAYIFERDVQLGTSVSAKLQRAIRRSDAVVAVLTKLGASSAYVQQEIGFAVNARKLVIPMVQKGASKKALALLGDVEYLLFDPDDREAAASELTPFLHRKSLQRKQQDDLMLAVVAVALILLLATETGT